MPCVAVSAQAQKLVRDAEIEALMHDAGRPLFRAAGLDPARVGISLINDRNLNAFVTNGQNIYAYRTYFSRGAEYGHRRIGAGNQHITGGHWRAVLKPHQRRSARITATILGMGSILQAPAIWGGAGATVSNSCAIF